MRTRESSRRGDSVSTATLRHAFREAPVVMALSTGLGSGLSPVVPGTAGSVVGLALAIGIARALSSPHGSSIAAIVGLLMSGLLVAAAGIPLAGRASRLLGAKDPRCVVIDEVCGQLLASSGVPLFAYPSRGAAAAVWLVSFLAFRFFDVVKPGPIRRSQDLPGGFGIVIDDVLAGILAAGTTAVLAFLVSGGRL